MYNEYDEEEDTEEETQSKGKLQDFYNNNKKLVWIFLGMIILVIFLSLFSGKSTSPSSAKLVIYYDNQEVKEVSVGKKKVINLVAKVDGKTNAYVKWSIADGSTSIATVDDSGYVRGVSVGKTEVVATYNDNVKATCTVNVVAGDPDIKLTSAALPDGVLMMGVGTEYELDVVVKPANGYVKSQTFKSNDTSVVTVDENGKVKAIAKGSAKISVSINDGLFTDDLMVYVNENMSTAKLTVNVESIKFQNSVQKIEVNKVTQMQFEVEPKNADLSSVIWKSSNENVVKVDEKSGALTGVSLGTALVKAYSLTGTEIASITVEVVTSLTEVTSITLPYPSITLVAGDTGTIKPTVVPDNASNKGLTYTSSDTSVATVTTIDGGITGTIKAVSKGTAVITITSSNGKVANLIVNVTSSSSGGGSGSNDDSEEIKYDNKGYIISSKDANNKGVVFRHYDSTSKSSNIGAGPLKITFEITSSTTSSLKICKYKYGSTACNPDTETTGVTEIRKGSSANVITIDSTGVWVIVVSEYNGTSRKSTLNWYTRLDTASGTTAESNVDCCYYKNGKYNYVSTTATSCRDAYGGTTGVSYTTCSAKNGGTTTTTTTKYANDTKEKCCYKKNGTWVNEEVASGTCTSKTGPGELYRTDSQCSAKNNQQQPTSSFQMSITSKSVGSRIIQGKYLTVTAETGELSWGAVFCYSMVTSGSSSSCSLNKTVNVSNLDPTSSYPKFSSQNTTYKKEFTGGAYTRTYSFDIDEFDSWYDNGPDGRDFVMKMASYSKDSNGSIIFSNVATIRVKNNNTKNHNLWTVSVS